MNKFFSFLCMVVGSVLLAISATLFIGFVILKESAGFLIVSIILITVSIFIITVSMRAFKQPAQKKHEPFVNPYVDVSLYETSNQIPLIIYPGLQLNPQEIIYFASPANTFIRQEEVLRYTGGSGGLSIRITGGLFYHAGGSTRTPIRGDVTKYNPGDHIVTNQRLVFIGIKNSFDLPLSKISAVKAVARDAFTIVTGNQQQNIQIDISQTEYALGMTYQVLKEFNEAGSKLSGGTPLRR